jgi:hypothetical protein
MSSWREKNGNVKRSGGGGPGRGKKLKNGIIAGSTCGGAER